MGNLGIASVYVCERRCLHPPVYLSLPVSTNRHDISVHRGFVIVAWPRARHGLIQAMAARRGGIGGEFRFPAVASGDWGRMKLRDRYALPARAL